jgi:hypothetical protein
MGMLTGIIARLPSGRGWHEARIAPGRTGQ